MKLRPHPVNVHQVIAGEAVQLTKPQCRGGRGGARVSEQARVLSEVLPLMELPDLVVWLLEVADIGIKPPHLGDSVQLLGVIGARLDPAAAILLLRQTTLVSVLSLLK